MIYLVKKVFIKVKHLIKKILREETESNEGKGQNDIMERRVRLFMKQVSKIPKLDKWLESTKNNGMSNSFSSDNESQWRGNVENIIDGIPKLMGGEIPRRIEHGHFCWMVVNMFFNNGGYNRDFSDTNVPVDLSPITIYFIDSDYKQSMAEYGSLWGYPLGATSTSEAEQMMRDNPYTWEDEREMNDTDDYGELEIYDINRSEEENLIFTKEMVGL